MKLRLCLAVLVVVLVTGCGGTYDSRVTGVVTLDGTPLPRGTVSFKPAGAGPTAYGFIESDGSYTLKTGREVGLPQGEYVVAVVANEPSVVREGSALPAPGRPITPRWYRTPKTSPLKKTIHPGRNKIDLELTSEPPPGWKSRKRKNRRR